MNPARRARRDRPTRSEEVRRAVRAGLGCDLVHRKTRGAPAGLGLRSTSGNRLYIRVYGCPIVLCGWTGLARRCVKRRDGGRSFAQGRERPPQAGLG